MFFSDSFSVGSVAHCIFWVVAAFYTSMCRVSPVCRWRLVPFLVRMLWNSLDSIAKPRTERVSS